MRQKIIAGAVALTLASFAAIGAFASQDGVSFKSLLSGGVLGSESGPVTMSVTTDTPTTTATATATTTGTVTVTTTPTVTGTPAATGTAEADDHERDIKGIPTSNPEHPEATGTCEKGEAAVKTTPAGTQVNVPCQAIGDHDDGQDGDKNDGHKGDHGDDKEGEHGSAPTGTPTPASTDTATPTATATP